MSSTKSVPPVKMGGKRLLYYYFKQSFARHTLLFFRLRNCPCNWSLRIALKSEIIRLVDVKLHFLRVSHVKIFYNDQYEVLLLITKLNFIACCAI